jgi:hypothetical protein
MPPTKKSPAPRRRTFPSYQALRLLALAVLLVALLSFTLTLSLLSLLALSRLNGALRGLLLFSHIPFFLVFVHAVTALVLGPIAVVHWFSFEIWTALNWMEIYSGVLS